MNPNIVTGHGSSEDTHFLRTLRPLDLVGQSTLATLALQNRTIDPKSYPGLGMNYDTWVQFHGFHGCQTCDPRFRFRLGSCPPYAPDFPTGIHASRTNFNRICAQGAAYLTYPVRQRH
jgi:hypothetical protein